MAVYIRKSYSPPPMSMCPANPGSTSRSEAGRHQSGLVWDQIAGCHPLTGILPRRPGLANWALHQNHTHSSQPPLCRMQNCPDVIKILFFYFRKQEFLCNHDMLLNLLRYVSISSTYPCQQVIWSVGHTGQGSGLTLAGRLARWSRRLPIPTLFEAKLFRAEADPAYASSLLFINCFYVLGLWLQSGSLYFAVSQHLTNWSEELSMINRSKPDRRLQEQCLILDSPKVLTLG